jgi:hypothetical protein
MCEFRSYRAVLIALVAGRWLLAAEGLTRSEEPGRSQLASNDAVTSPLRRSPG